MKQQTGTQQQTLYSRRLQESGMTFTLSVVLPVLCAAVLILIVGESEAREADWFLYLSYLLPQLCMAAAVAVYFKRTRQPFLETFRPCKWHYFVIAVLLQFGLLFSVSELNQLFIGFLQTLGYQVSESSSLPNLDGVMLLPALLVIALLPALVEETVFRGILVRNLDENGSGLAATLVISGILFSIIHASPEQTVYQFVCGVCFALIVVRSKSVLPTMLAHFLNNAVILILTSQGYETEWTFPSALNIALIVSSAVCFAGALGYLIFAGKRGNGKGKERIPKGFWLYACVGILACVVQWIAALIAGVGNV